METEICTAETLVPEPSCWEVDTAVEKLKTYKSLNFDQISAQLIQAVDDRW
jgi:hypothetical protein